MNITAFNLEIYYKKLDEAKDPLEKILLKKEFNEYFRKLKPKEKKEIERQKEAYFDGKIQNYNLIISEAKQQMATLGIEI